MRRAGRWEVVFAALLLQIYAGASLHAQSTQYVPAFKGGLGQGAVFRNAGFLHAARACLTKFPFSRYSDVERRQKDCLAGFMKTHGASGQAIAFMRSAPVPAAISAVRRFGKISVVHAEMMWADAADGWALVTSSGQLLSLWYGPSDFAEPAAYRAFLKKHPGATLWSDRVSWPVARRGADDSEQLTFRFTLRRCRACAVLAYADIAYVVAGSGRFMGSRLVRLVPAN